MKATATEQLICIECGFCCDGTLFDHANLEPEEKGTLPGRIEKAYFKLGEKECFKLPCDYFNEKCTIYNKKKAKVCSTYRCQLLVNVSKGIIDSNDALKIVANTRAMRSEVLSMTGLIDTASKNITFRELLKTLQKINSGEKNIVDENGDIKTFIAKCNILETLMIYHFKSEADFESMKTPLNENEPNNIKPGKTGQPDS